MTTTLTIPSLDAIDSVARQFVDLMDDYTVFAFNGEMGAGKTTFINALSRVLGVDEDPTSSPSFAIINEYRSSTTAELISTSTVLRISMRLLTLVSRIIWIPAPYVSLNGPNASPTFSRMIQ